jgi:hypothetical protein
MKQIGLNTWLVIVTIFIVIVLYFLTPDETAEKTAAPVNMPDILAEVNKVPKLGNPLKDAQIPEPSRKKDFEAYGNIYQDRYRGYLADESFIRNFPFTPQYRTESWPDKPHSECTYEERMMKQHHFFVYDFYTNGSRHTKAFQILTEVLEEAGCPKDGYAHGIIFNALNEAAMYKRLHKQHPENERFKNLLGRAEGLENSMAGYLTSSQLWVDGAPLDRKAAELCATELFKRIDMEAHFADFHHFCYHVDDYHDTDYGKRLLLK